MALRPKSDRPTRIGQIPTITDARRPLYPELPMAVFGSEDRSAHEQPRTVSGQKVAFIHGYIIPHFKKMSK